MNTFASFNELPEEVQKALRAEHVSVHNVHDAMVYHAVKPTSESEGFIASMMSNGSWDLKTYPNTASFRTQWEENLRIAGSPVKAKGN